MIDIARYAAHPDCGTLVSFIYDPEHRIKNPVALERDLSGAARRGRAFAFASNLGCKTRSVCRLRRAARAGAYRGHSTSEGATP